MEITHVMNIKHLLIVRRSFVNGSETAVWHFAETVKHILQPFQMANWTFKYLADDISISLV